MIMELFLLVLGIAILMKGSDFFIAAASRVAGKLGISHFIIGLTLVAIGTSIPELAASIIASINNQSELILGNIVGTNIANITLIIGITALFASIKTTRNMLDRDGYIMMFAGLTLVIFLMLGSINLIGGIIMLSFYLAYAMFLIKIKSKQEIEDFKFRDFFNYYIKMEYLTTIKEKIIIYAMKKENLTKEEKKALYSFREGLIKDFLMIILSMSAIIIGAKMLVDQAIWFTGFFGISQNLIGLSVMALGTSLPELSVTLSAARKGLGSMVIGNIIGSNIANILLVLGISAIINPIIVTDIGMVFEGLIMLGTFLLLLIFIKSEWKIHKYEGIILLLIYSAFLLMIIFSAI